MRLTRAGSPVVSSTGAAALGRPRHVARMPRQIVLQAVGHHLGLRQQPRERRQVPAEQVLDQRIVRAAEDRAMRRRAAASAPAGRRRPAATSASSSCLRRALLDGAGQLRAGLLHHRHLRTALADLLRVDVRGDGARGAEHGDQVGVVLLRILRRRHGPRRLRGRLHGRRDDAEDVAPRPAADRQPVLLQRARGHAGRRIAAEQHQPAAAPEQRVDAVARQRDDLVGGPVAVGHVAVVAEIDEADARKALRPARGRRSGRRGRNRRRRSCA